eukprot:363288-Chlamydomonas_euryale.AAC.2
MRARLDDCRCHMNRHAVNQQCVERRGVEVHAGLQMRWVRHWVNTGAQLMVIRAESMGCLS